MAISRKSFRGLGRRSQSAGSGQAPELAIRLPFEPEMWLVPLFGHTRGHCGVAIQTESGWLFHVGDAAPMGLAEYVPEWLVSFVLGPHAPRLREFRAVHPKVCMTTGHMWLDFFEE